MGEVKRGGVVVFLVVLELQWITKTRHVRRRHSRGLDLVGGGQKPRSFEINVEKFTYKIK